jgi:hypothetical protein
LNAPVFFIGLFMKLNVERQGEGGTLALNDVNNTTIMEKNQDLIYKSIINISLGFYEPSVCPE